MRRYKISDEVPLRALFSWMNLSFTAGAINAGGFLSCQRFVSHVTGFVTIAGHDFVHDTGREAFSALSIPLYFLIGAMISAYLSEHQDSHRNRPFARNFAPAIGLVALILVTVIALGQTGYFGVFGEFENIQADYLQLALLCMACGIQNAAVTSATGSTIRPTHLTGTTTDLGIGLVRSFIYRRNSEARRHEIMVSQRRIYLILAFVSGAMIGTWFCARFEYLGFLLPVVTAIVSIIDTWNQKRPILTTRESGESA